MNSVWTDSVDMPYFETLEGEVKTDVLIIGRGITGILCAYFLKEKGVDSMSPFGLCSEMECCGAFLGLSLPRFSV